MLSHITVGVADAERARAFYRPLMEALGLALKFSESHWAGWCSPNHDRPLFIITRPFDAQAAAAGNGSMVALLARSISLVDQCHVLALQHGGRDEGRPGLRPEYHPNYYGAYFRDLDGNKLCVCCHEPNPS
jgi:catechol 2,3-dioxygenase-like lactoylglutathione lyase family enzyme